MSIESGLVLVQALYSFKGKNNDELCFKKDDIITITQKEEGGWWEGTLDDKTGWFPSNYVKEYKGQDGSKSPVQEEELMSPQQSQQQKVYRNLVLKDILETERSHVGDMQGLLSKYLSPLYKSEILSENEYKQLVGNLEEVVAAHVNLVTAIDEQTERPSREQRVGGAFLTMAPILQNVHTNYCANHPKAVCMLGKYKDELNSFMECEGAHKPGIMVLTTGLSKPFRRLDKYAGMLQEYERHLEEGHPDRGDTQRSSHVYKDMASSCGAVRRQKELELEVLTGTVHGWDGGGENLSSLGDIVHMGSVALLPDHRDRYLVLFPACLIMLAVSPRMSAFIFEGKYHLTGIHVNKLEDNEHHKNAIEITGHMAERIIAVCQTRDDQNQWVEVLKQQIRTARTSNFSLHKPPALNPVPPTHSTAIPPRQASTSSVANNFELTARASRPAGGKVWSMSCLRPSPPLRPGLSTREDKRNQRHNKKKEEKWHEEDALILRVIESYCTSAKTRYTVNSTLLEAPQVLIAEDEKIIVEETSGNQVVVQEKSLVDTVYALKDQIAALVQDQQNMKKEFEAERKAAKSLRCFIKQHILIGRDDINWEDLGF